MLLASVSTAVAGACVTPFEQTALEKRVIQSELGISALVCNEAKRYNAFVRAYRPELLKVHGDLRKMFERIYPGRGEHQLNDYLTTMANQSSLRSATDRKGFCNDADDMLDKISGRSGVELSAFAAAQPISSEHGFQSCAREASAEPAQPKDRSVFSFKLFDGDE
jgi:hypothetical protein